MTTSDGFTTHAVLAVRHADCDVDAFTEQVAALASGDIPRIVDLSQHENHGNQIVLRSSPARGTER